MEMRLHDDTRCCTVQICFYTEKIVTVRNGGFNVLTDGTIDALHSTKKGSHFAYTTRRYDSGKIRITRALALFSDALALIDSN